MEERSPLLLTDEERFNLSKSVGSPVFCLDCKALENLKIATDIRFDQTFTHPTEIVPIHQMFLMVVIMILVLKTILITFQRTGLSWSTSETMSSIQL